jgi:RNase adapter protein RapZ
MRIILLTGMSGSGKSTAIHSLEDLGFYAIDNLPLRFLDQMIELIGTTAVEKLALVFDARTAAVSPGELGQMTSLMDNVKKRGHQIDLVFLDASDEVLERRYSETRRRHPLSAQGSVKGGIGAERKMLEPVLDSATIVINTTSMSVHDLKRAIQGAFTTGPVEGPGMSITVLSFGYKHGVPPEADLMIDVRFLPNPYFVQELRDYSGEDEAVARYVLEREETRELMSKLRDLLAYLLPKYEKEGKAYLTVAIGCTGGRHRSVAIAAELTKKLAEEGRRVQVRHRDAGRWSRKVSRA